MRTIRPLDEIQNEGLAVEALVRIAEIRAWFVCLYYVDSPQACERFQKVWTHALTRFLAQTTREVCEAFIDINLN